MTLRERIHAAAASKPVRAVDNPYPPLREQALSLAKAAGRVGKALATNKRVIATEDEQARRLVICKDCTYYHKKDHRCKSCGCALTAKITFDTETCPNGYWHRDEDSLEVWIAGYPSQYGGADTELDHNIDLLRKYNVDVHLVPMFGSCETMRTKCRERKCFTHKYRPDIFKDKIVMSFCNGEFLSKLPEIMEQGMPKRVIWFNCMTWTFPMEIEAHRNGWIDYHGFVSDYQEKWLRPELEKVAPVQKFEGYTPYFNIADNLFNYSEPTTHFAMGRLSRDDGGKFSSDMWKIFHDVKSPIPTKTFIMSWGENARRKCGEPPVGLDWMTYNANAIPVKEFYHQLHAIIHKTGGSRESYCRIVPEAYAHGVPLIVEDDYAFPELIIDGVTGFLCKTSAEMSERASWLASDEKLRKEIITNGYQHLREVLINPDQCWSAWKAVLTVE